MIPNGSKGSQDFGGAHAKAGTDYDRVDDAPAFSDFRRARTHSDMGKGGPPPAQAQHLLRGRAYSDMTNTHGSGLYSLRSENFYNAAVDQRAAEQRSWKPYYQSPFPTMTFSNPGSSDIFGSAEWNRCIGKVDETPLPPVIPDNSHVILMPASVNDEPYTFNKISGLINREKKEGWMRIATQAFSGMAYSLEHGWEGKEPSGKRYWCSEEESDRALLSHYEKRGTAPSWYPSYRGQRPASVDVEGKVYTGKPYWCAFSKQKTVSPVFSNNAPTKEEVCTLYMVLTGMGAIEKTSEKVMCRDIVPGVFTPERVSVEITQNEIHVNSTSELGAKARAYAVSRFGKDSNRR